MDAALSETSLQDWVQRLDKHFNGLQDRFGPDILHNKLFKAMSVAGDDGKVCLGKIRTASDVLDAVKCFMGLAVTHNVPAAGSEKRSTTLKIQNKRDSAPNPLYLSVQLHDAESQMRLIELLPGRDKDPIAINLFAIDSLSSQTYEALSYVWGSRDADETISVNGGHFKVSANLAQALRCLRPIENSKVLWVDAICINQADDVEKSYQVSLIGDIFRNAEDVVIFLGEERDDSAMVMQYLDLEDAEQTEGQSPTSDAATEDAKQANEAKKDVDHRTIQARIHRCGFDSGRFLRAVDAFFKRPWWSRVWVVQEFALATREPRWYCGRLGTSTANISDRLWKLYHYFIAEAMPGTGNPAVYKHEQVDVTREFNNMFERSWNTNPRFMDREWLREAKRPYQIMLAMLRRQSTDPRDRIFAFQQMLDPISKQVFVPNYAATVNETFAKLVSYLLVHDEHGHIYDLYELVRSRNTPSWVVDFAKPLSIQGVSHLSTHLSASWANNVGHLSIYNRVMGVPGVEIDTLDVVECFGDASDIELLGMFWKLEGLLQNISPTEPLPEIAQSSLPSYCLLPFPDLNSHFKKAGADMLSSQFPTTGTIPGFFQVILEGIKLLVKRTTPSLKKMTCEEWERPPSELFRDDLRALMAKLIGMSMKPLGSESFLGGACFDLPNLQTQIMSVQLPDYSHHDLTSPQRPSDLKVSQGSMVKTHRSIGDYCPQYSHIKDILRQSKSQIELDALKNAACTFADIYREIVTQHTAMQAPLVAQWMPFVSEVESEISAHFMGNDSYLRELSEKCTCEGDKQNRHRQALKSVSEANKGLRDHYATILAERIPGKGPKSPKVEAVMPGLNATFRRQYTGMFITRLGFFGVSFQRQPDIKSGDKLVVLDGIPAPMVLEKLGDGETYRMKVAADVVGIRHVDIARLVELGLCKQRDYRIV